MSAYVERAEHVWTITLGRCTRAAVGDVGKTVSEAADALQAAVQANRFGVMQVHSLKETMVNKGVEFAHGCLIFEVSHRNGSQA